MINDWYVHQHCQTVWIAAHQRAGLSCDPHRRFEFNISTSDLKYDISEALSIHAENDPTQVMEFIKFYCLNPEEVVEVADRDYSSIRKSDDLPISHPEHRHFRAASERLL